MKDKINRRWLIVCGCLVLPAAALSLGAYLTLFFPGDLYLTRQIQSLDNTMFRQSMEWISFLFGDWRVLILIAVAVSAVWWRLGGLEGAAVLIAGAATYINPFLKLMIERPRPSPDLVQVPLPAYGWSFPSGHTFTAVLLLGIIAYLIAARSRKGILRTLLVPALLLLMLLVGISRVYLGVHWPSDVLGAYLWGGLFLTLLIYCYEWWRIYRPTQDASSACRLPPA